MKVAVVVAFMVGFVTVMAAFVVLSIAGKDTTPFAIFAGGAATSLVPQLFNLLKVHQTQSDVEQMKSDVAQVKERTNGPLDAMKSTIDGIAAQVENIEKKAVD
jgi:hypothetical protein